MTDAPAPDRDRLVALSERFGQLARSGEAYYEAVDKLPYDGSGTVWELEERIARNALMFLASARAVRDILDATPSRIIPTDVRRSLDRFVSIVEAQSRRWGWSYILEPDGKARVGEKLEGHEQSRWIPVLRAALAWRSMPGVEHNPNADGLKDEAEDLGLEPLELPPGTSPETAKELTWALYREWHGSPVLGPALPSLDDGERLELAKASDRLRRHAESLGRPTIEVEPGSAGIDAEYATRGGPMASSPPADEPESPAKVDRPKAHERQKNFKKGELDERATAKLMTNPSYTNHQIAGMLGCHVKSLSKAHMVKFLAAREALERGKDRYRRPDSGASEREADSPDNG